MNERVLLGPRLKETSRSFFLSIRVLPPGLRGPIGVAYLLARMADTLADRLAGTASERKKLLQEFRRAIRREKDFSLHKELTLSLAPPEKRLMQAVPQTIRFFKSLSQELKQTIKQVVSTLIEGMMFDLEVFDSDQLKALCSERELDRYTYLIAGCVGEFWTCVALWGRQIKKGDFETLKDLGVKYGKGLQLINILRDLPKDLERKRLYLPEERLNECGVKPNDLYDPESFVRLRPLYRHYLARARELVLCGLDYVLRIPKRSFRLRLASLWPLWIGLGTLCSLAQTENILVEPPVRIPRKKTYQLLVTSLPLVFFDGLISSKTAALADFQI